MTLSRTNETGLKTGLKQVLSDAVSCQALGRHGTNAPNSNDFLQKIFWTIHFTILPKLAVFERRVSKLILAFEYSAI